MVAVCLPITSHEKSVVLWYARESDIEPSVVWDVANQIFSTSVANVPDSMLDAIVSRNNEKLKKVRIVICVSSALVILTLIISVTQMNRIEKFFYNSSFDLLCLLLFSGWLFLYCATPFMRRINVYINQIEELNRETQGNEIFKKYRSQIAMASSLHYLPDINRSSFHQLFSEIANVSEQTEIINEAYLQFLDSIKWRFPMSLTDLKN